LRWWSLTNFLPRLVSNYDPPDLCLPRSWDYSSKPLHPGDWAFLVRKKR
jgi:hypothetical protein